MNDHESMATHAMPQTPSRVSVWCEVLLIFVVFGLHAGRPAPDVNESHYLAKATHYWNPTWCARDFFVVSRDAHQVFVWTCGWLTLWLPLPAVAWVGRIVTWSLLAWAWRRASFAVVPVRWAAVLTAAMFVALLSRADLAGEWVVGGFEAKGLAYALLLLALESLARGGWRRLWLLLGAATAFHVLVGGWSVLAAGFCWFRAGSTRPALATMLPAMCGGLILALPGIVPAVLLGRDIDRELADQANQIYVFQRLPHHLALHLVAPEVLKRHLVANGLLLASWLLLWRTAPATEALRRVGQFVLATTLIATVGLAVSWLLQSQPAWQAAILRYYWYRLYDFALPLGTSLAAAAVIAAQWRAHPRYSRAVLAVAIAVAVAHLIDVQRVRIQRPHARANSRTLPEADWISACRWAADHTPPDALFLTPRGGQTFKWYAGRAEVVTNKDIPQSAAGILQWWQRIDEVHRREFAGQRRFCKSLAQQGAPQLERLGSKYGAGFVLTQAEPVVDLPRIYHNNTFAIYQLNQPDRATLQP